MATQSDFDRLGKWAVILNPDLAIDRHTCERQMPMEILSLGAPRTGTLSMSEAYTILGYPSYHYASIFANSRDSDMWLTALDAKFHPSSHGDNTPFTTPAFFDALLGHVSAITDVPAVIFWRELITLYPKAKVILVQRSEDKWLASMRVLVSGILNPVGRYVLRFTDPSRTGRILNCGLAWVRCWFQVEGHLTLEKAMANAPAVYRKHYDDIRAAVPKDRLLEYELGSGWGPLCEFLGKEVPDVPFPNRNDAAMLDRAFGVFLKKALAASLVNLCCVGAVGAAVVGVWWKMV